MIPLTGTQLTDREAHLANMRSVIAENFGEQPPAVTKRSKGLDPQCGVIVGLRPTTNQLFRLANAVAHLSTTWFRYDSSALHLTLGDQVDRDHAAPTEELTATFDKLRDVIKLPGEQALPAGRLTNLRLRINADTIILAGEPDAALLDLRALLLGKAEAVGITPGWSSGHLTVARLSQPLTEHERLATAAWLRNAYVPDVLTLDMAIAGLFVASDNAFRFQRAQLASITV